MSAPVEPDALLTPLQAAVLLQVRISSVYRWIYLGKLPCERVPRGKHGTRILIRRAAAEAVLDSPEYALQEGMRLCKGRRRSQHGVIRGGGVKEEDARVARFRKAFPDLG